MMHELIDPRIFFQAFSREIQVDRPPIHEKDSDEPWTKWIERVMIAIAKHASPILYCQNKQSKKLYKDEIADGYDPGCEYLGTDHMFFSNPPFPDGKINADWGWDQFPVIAVEHESGGPNKQKMALWKVLCLRVELGVVVVYPNPKKRKTIIHAFDEMLLGWKNRFNHAANILVLFGWWTGSKKTGHFAAREECERLFGDDFSPFDEFEPFVPDISTGKLVRL